MGAAGSDLVGAYLLKILTAGAELTAGVRSLIFDHGDVFQWGPIIAGSVLSAAPIMILYFITQRFMVQGMTLGAVKG